MDSDFGVLVTPRISSIKKLYAKMLKHLKTAPDGIELWKNEGQKSYDTVVLDNIKSLDERE